MALVWVVSRFNVDEREQAVDEGILWARGAYDDDDGGAVSVWVEDQGRIVWAAGRKAAELRRHGVRLDRLGSLMDEVPSCP